MATIPDNTPIGPTHQSRPSKMMIVILVGIVIGFFVLVMTQNPEKEAQQKAAPAATTQQGQ